MGDEVEGRWGGFGVGGGGGGGGGGFVAGGGGDGVGGPVVDVDGGHCFVLLMGLVGLVVLGWWAMKVRWSWC